MGTPGDRDRSDLGLPAEVADELHDLLGDFSISRRLGSGPRNDAYLVRASQTTAVIKIYRHLSTSEVHQVVTAERLVAGAGVAVPALLHCSDRVPLTVHEYVPGRHGRPRVQSEIDDCARQFCAQIIGLEGFRPTWSPARPVALPARAADAVRQSDSLTGAIISTTWSALCELAVDERSSTSHIDWRADNLVLGDDAVRAVLDWEALAVLPGPEAAGLAAASFTHSWSDSTYEPFNPEDVHRFVNGLRHTRPGLIEGTNGTHLWLAILFAACTRIVEDSKRGVVRTSSAALAEAVPEPCRSDDIYRLIETDGTQSRGVVSP